MKMSKQIKALLLDIDGVVLNKETDTNPELWVKLNEIKQSGIQISFLTSRPYAFCSHILDRFDSNGIHAFDCGGYIVDTEMNFIKHSSVLPNVLTEKLIEYFRDNDPESKFGLSSGKRFYTNPRYLENLNNYMPTITASLILDTGVEDVNSVWIRDATPKSVKFVNEAVKEIGVILKSYKNEDKHSMFILPKDATKINGANIWAKATGIDLKDVMYIADEDSDIEVLKEVGYPACPGNASSKVKLICSITSTDTYSNGATKCISNTFQISI